MAKTPPFKLKERHLVLGLFLALHFKPCLVRSLKSLKPKLYHTKIMPHKVRGIIFFRSTPTSTRAYKLRTVWKFPLLQFDMGHGAIEKREEKIYIAGRDHFFFASLRARRRMEDSCGLCFRLNSSLIFTYAFLNSVFIAILFPCNFSQPSVNERLIARSVSCLDVVITPWSLFIMINLSWIDTVYHRLSPWSDNETIIYHR